MPTPISSLETVAGALDSISEFTGRLTAWLVLLMTLLVCWDVAARYLFHEGSVALQELEWHLFAMIFLLGAAYTLKHDAHVRVEVVYGRLSRRKQLYADIFGTLFFLIPFSILVIVASLGFVDASLQMHEGSPDPGGLPYRWLLKACIPLGFSLLVLQGIANIFHHIVELKQEANH